MSNVLEFTARETPNESDTLADILAAMPAPPEGLHATKEERLERYARLSKEGKVRAARASFKVVS